MNQTMITSLAAAAIVMTSHEAFCQDRGTGQYETIQATGATRSTSVGVNLTSTDVDVFDDNAFAFGVFGDLHMSPAFSVGMSVDYWNDEYRSSATRDVELGDVVIGANGKFHFTDLAAGFRPYVLAGLAGHVLQVTTSERNTAADPAEVLSARDRDLEDADFELGTDFGAGFNYRIQSNMDLVGEVRYRRLFEQTLDLDQRNYSLALAYAM
ncbi:MAG TPA: porin family protein [Oligoflexus sp.]|uniref:porin family protein n=1 Tax=Oligoflexus sp. TaxID=1971216 RepID=UPI002D44C2E2|nr:porin family protein [Oligoflexus sp.]HYX37104.1 porin family protein [Oligoflexus sp.]